MASLYKQTTNLSGTAHAVTGQYIDVSRASSLNFTLKGTGIEGSPVLTLYKPSPFDVGTDIAIYTHIASASGFTTGLNHLLPLNQIKAGVGSVASGIFWVAFGQSNY